MADTDWDDKDKAIYDRYGMQDFSTWCRMGSAPRRIRPTDVDCVLNDDWNKRNLWLEFKPSWEPIAKCGQLRFLGMMAAQGDVSFVVSDSEAKKVLRKEGIETLPDDHPLELYPIPAFVDWEERGIIKTDVAGLNQVVREFYVSKFDDGFRPHTFWVEQAYGRTA